MSLARRQLVLLTSLNGATPQQMRALVILLGAMLTLDACGDRWILSHGVAVLFYD